MPTGLSDEEDARRYLAMRFNSVFCPNCEHHYEVTATVIAGNFCPHCKNTLLQPFGSDPIPTRFKR